MKFRWTPVGRGQSAPLLAVGLRRHGIVMVTTPMLLVDTGADGVLLNLYLAALLGFQDIDLVTEECTGAGGPMTVQRPKTLDGAEIEIGGTWLSIPSLKFAPNAPFSLLGRDLIFSHFELRMTASEFELLPLPKKK